MPTFTPQSTFYLIKNVDIDISYTHQYYFSTESSQYNFFYGKKFKTVTAGSYQRKNSNVIQLPFQSDEIADAKYMMWQNANYSNKWYYAFVTSVNYVNPNVTTISYELDVYQTYLFDVTWKQSFVEREHCTRFNNGVPVINVEDEGLDYGSNYKVLTTTKLAQTSIPNLAWCIFGVTDDTGFSSTIKRYSGSGSYGNIATNIRYFVMPFTYSSEPSYDDVYYVNGTLMGTPQDAFTLYSTDQTLVGRLVSAYVTPYAPFTIDSVTTSYPGGGIRNINITAGWLHTGTIQSVLPVSVAEKYAIQTLTDPVTKYYDFPNYTESKLYMYPYSFTELTNGRGTSEIIKMEYITESDSKIRIGVYGTLSVRNTLSALIKNYLGTNYNRSVAITFSDSEGCPIIDDYTASYLQANSNSIAVAQSNAMLVQQNALANAQASFDTASANAARTYAGSTATNITGGITGFLGNIVSGFTGMLGAKTTTQANAEFGSGVVGGISNLANTAATQYSIGQSYKNAQADAETSKANNTRSANTSYETTVASALAKVHDAEQVASNTRNMGGDFLFNMLSDVNGLYLIKKTITTEYANKLTDFFKQYGYKVNKLETPNFHTRASWNYIKMLEPNVYGNIPMADLMQIRDIYLKGITLWHGDYIGDYSRSNNEI